MNGIMRYGLASLAILALGVPVGLGQSAADAAPKIQETAPLDATELSRLRDPFWPIGWTPPPVESTLEAPTDKPLSGPVRWAEATRMLEPTALTQLPNGAYIAVLKGIGVVEVGDQVAVKHGGLIYRWVIKSISSEGIVPQRLSVSAPRGS